ncbi:response regulator [Fulvivirga ligni]|uniref:response regulator n=1 Tax=Fulvivirga ligni TaxID=2904246 RepID=UPI001F16ECB6|nr:response regulator [Fulvivirga ligni]UII19658.1 response regulator [Fulvivirga ligni]
MDIVCVEDNEDFTFFLSKALKDLETIEYGIYGQATDAMGALSNGEISLPKMFLLDIDLPDMDGFTFLRELRDSSLYRNIPVVMLSSSDNPTDIQKASQLGANAYVTKPGGFKQIKGMVADICDFWLKHHKLPAA